MRDIAHEQTLIIIKPDGVEKRLVGKILARIEALGLTVKDVRQKTLSQGECRRLYPKTRETLPEIYAAVETHMTGSPSIIVLIEGVDAVAEVRKLRGPTNLLEAPPGTVRRDFVTEEERDYFAQGHYRGNRMHASGSYDEAQSEISLFFDREEA